MRGPRDSARTLEVMVVDQRMSSTCSRNSFVSGKFSFAAACERQSKRQTVRSCGVVSTFTQKISSALVKRASVRVPPTSMSTVHTRASRGLQYQNQRRARRAPTALRGPSNVPAYIFNARAASRIFSPRRLEIRGQRPDVNLSRTAKNGCATKGGRPLQIQTRARTRTWPRIGTGADLAWFWGCRNSRSAPEELGLGPTRPRRGRLEDRHLCRRRSRRPG